VRFTGRIGGSTLTSGRWRLTITATDREGRQTAPQSTAFELVGLR